MIRKKFQQGCFGSLKTFGCGAALILWAFSPAQIKAAAPGTLVQSNDDIADAIAFTNPDNFASWQFYATMTDATASASDPTCGAPIYQTLWYSYTSPVDQFLDVALREAEGVRPRISAWTGTPDALTVAQCDPDAHEVAFQAKAGQTYYFEVGSPEPEGDTSTYIYVTPYSTVTWPIPPANDLFWYAVPIPSIPATFSGDVGASTADYSYDPDASGNSIWYSYTATTTGQLDAGFVSPQGPEGVVVISGSLDNPVYAIDNAYGDLFGGDGKVRFNATAGTTYYLMYVDDIGVGTSYVADMSLQASPPQVGGTATIGQVSILSHKLKVELQGNSLSVFIESEVSMDVQLTCAAPSPSVNVTVDVTQGQYTVAGYGTTSCAGGSAEVTVTGVLDSPIGSQGGILPGVATAKVIASDFDTNYVASSGPTSITVGGQH